MATIQGTQFELMRRSSFNDFDGERVVQLLKDHRDLWKRAKMERDNLMPIGDISQGQSYVDTLYLTVIPGKEEELERLARREFHADTVDWLDGVNGLSQLGIGADETRVIPKKVLVCWWD